MRWEFGVPEKDGHYIVAIYTHYDDDDEPETMNEVHEAWFHHGFWTWNDGYGETVMKGNSDETTMIYAWADVPCFPDVPRVPIGKGA